MRAAKRRSLLLVLAAIAIFAAPAGFASIPRSDLLESTSIDFRHVDVVDVDASIDNDELLARALDRAMATSSPVGSLLESRVWVSRLERPLFDVATTPLSRSLHQGSARAWPEIASERTVLTPDPSGYADSSNLYAFAGGDPVNRRDPTGEAASVSKSGWIIATDNRNGGRQVKFSPEHIAQHGDEVRAFLGRNADIAPRDADAMMVQARQGAWVNNQRITAVSRQVSAGIDDIAVHSASTYASSLPGVGDLKDAQEVYTGEDLVTGEKLSKTQRVVTAVAAAVPVVGGKVLREAIRSRARTAEELVSWVDEGGDLRAGGSAGMRPDAYSHQSSAPGARSNVLTGRSQAPYLEFTDPAGNVVGAKFDGVQGIELIDRKLNPFFSKKAVDQATRQAAVAEYYGLKAVWELPSKAAVEAANRFLMANGISGITVRLAP